jgi:peptidoglycan/LPS O-acetylase OafA/YrhL
MNQSSDHSVGVEPLETTAVRPLTSALAPSAGNRIPELDGLRGIAIGLVVLFHSFYFDPGSGYQAKDLVHHLYAWFEGFIAIGWTGVDLFFVLSGFLIGGILLDTKDSPRYYRTFYARRFFRIIPAYYAWILVYIIVIVVCGRFISAHVQASSTLSWRHGLPVQLLFLQNVAIVTSYPAIAGTWFRPTWSLAVEEQFYLVTPALAKGLSEGGLGIFLAVVTIFAPLLRVWIRFHIARQSGDLGLAYVLMPCRADALGIGFLTAILWRRNWTRTWLSQHGVWLYAGTGIFVVGFAILAKWWPSSESLPMQSIGYTWVAMSYALILLLVLVKAGGPIAWIMRRSLLRELGRVSYSLYLIHGGVALICTALVFAALKHVHSWEGIATNAVAATLSFGLARLSWTYFEHPLVRRGHAFKN